MNIASLVSSTVFEHGTRNPFNICKARNIEVEFHSLLLVRGYHKIDDGHFFIVLSDALSELASKFVCAHELGHCFLHKRINRVFLDGATHLNTSRYETEADKFAAHLIFGDAPMFKAPYTDHDMADMLNVPIYQVEERLSNLGIYY